MVSKGVQRMVEKVCNVVTKVHKAGVASIKRSGTLKLRLESKFRLFWTRKTDYITSCCFDLPFPFDLLFLTVIYVRPQLPTLVFRR